jgi:hypothetical protein
MAPIRERPLRKSRDRGIEQPFPSFLLQKPLIMSTARSLLRSGLLFGASIALLSFELPAGWLKAGNKPDSYDMGTDAGAGRDGKSAATIKSIYKKVKGFGTLMQMVPADSFAGKRVRMSAYVKAENVGDWAGLWFRVDKKGNGGSLAFDNMRDRPIKGTADWTAYEVVLDVAKDATGVAYGALLSGTGQIWFDDLKFEFVDLTVPTTGRSDTITVVPSNLDFEK